MAKGNSLPKGLEAKVRAAGGTIDRYISQIGLVVVSSSDPGFPAKAARIAGISDVMPNVVLQWVTPIGEVNIEDITLNEEFGNPPNSGDDDTRFNLQWGHDAVDAPEAWNEGYRGAGVRVAVLDSGFDLDHPDLAPNINFALSTNFVAGETLSYALPDPFSHGSHTAGTIAAADNGFGTIGVAPEAELVLVKVLGDGGSGSFADVISGIVYAADVDADVINMSLGAALEKNGFCDEEGCVTANEVAALVNAIKRATTYADQQGTTIIASAGNDAIDLDHTDNLIHVPSALPKVISISATAPIGWATDPGNIFLDNLASYSNFGQSAIDFGAPGGDFVYPGNELCTISGVTRPCWVFDLVFSTGSNLNPAIASYYWSAGTSMAAPHASGVAAIIIGKNGGDMPPAQVEAALRASADDLGKPGNDDAYGAGRVNAYNAVR
ncbi:MAG: peptidase S8 and S53 subtilisin kexin sedolisin [Chloroflexi bacterium]|nr:peptidase S8 and S53 subtilisin kexin sedolisin [Chloroflexota bacterium]MDL1941327.1 peptidase S8 and S53 subtilisin kexin sedolisin [Chloroflexi bacterium CFX2]